MFFTLFGYWARRGGGGPPKGLVHNLLMQLFILGSSKIEVFESYFFDIVITQNDHPRYVKHLLGRIYVVPYLGIGCGEGGGGGSQLGYVAFHPGQLKNHNFQNFFLIL